MNRKKLRTESHIDKDEHHQKKNEKKNLSRQEAPCNGMYPIL